MENEHSVAPKDYVCAHLKVLLCWTTTWVAHTAVASIPVSFNVAVWDLLVGKSLFTSFLLIMGNRFSKNVRDTLLILVQTLQRRYPPALYCIYTAAGSVETHLFPLLLFNFWSLTEMKRLKRSKQLLPSYETLSFGRLQMNHVNSEHCSLRWVSNFNWNSKVLREKIVF